MSTLTPGRAVECFECSHITPTDDETEVCEACMSDNTAPVTVTACPEPDKSGGCGDDNHHFGFKPPVHVSAPEV